MYNITCRFDVDTIVNVHKRGSGGYNECNTQRSLKELGLGFAPHSALNPPKSPEEKPPIWRIEWGDLQPLPQLFPFPPASSPSLVGIHV